jgi:hypothetical protein
MSSDNLKRAGFTKNERKARTTLKPKHAPTKMTMFNEQV